MHTPDAPQRALRLAFVAGLSDGKLKQFLEPLQLLEFVENIDVYRRRPIAGDKIRWMPLPRWIARNPVAGDLWRCGVLLMAASRYDAIIGCFQQFHGLWAHLAAHWQRKPAIQLIITDVDWNFARIIPRRTMLQADACGVMGPISQEKLRQRGYKGPVEVITLPHAPRNVRLTPRPFAYDCLAVGSYAEEKDYPWMLEVFAALRRRRPDTRLAMVGDGLRQALRPRVEALGLQNNIDFLGFLGPDALAEAYQDSRLLVMTSNVEGLPMVAVEAMSYGKPVVATPVGDLPWLIRQGVDGFLVAHGDTEGFSRTLADILDNPEQIDVMGRNANERYTALLPLFTSSHVAQRWKSLLLPLLQGKQDLHSSI